MHLFAEPFSVNIPQNHWSCNFMQNFPKHFHNYDEATTISIKKTWVGNGQGIAFEDYQYNLRTYMGHKFKTVYIISKLWL